MTTVEQPEGHTLVRITSHRARQRVVRLVPSAEMLFARDPSGRHLRVEAEFSYVPDRQIDEVLRVPGVTRAHPRGDLFRPLGYTRTKLTAPEPAAKDPY
jgi:hypothetical protein